MSLGRWLAEHLRPRLARSFNIVVVNPASRINSISDLITEAKANPGKLNFGTFGTGTSAHLAGELFDALAKVKMTAVPYRRGARDQRSPGGTDRRDVHHRGKRGLAGGSRATPRAGRHIRRAVDGVPQLPTVAEAGVPGYAAES